MRQMKITVTVQQDGQLRKYADSEHRYWVEVEGELSEKKVFRFCRDFLNAGGVPIDEWRLLKDVFEDDESTSIYFNGYFTFDKISEEKDSRGIVTKASYTYKVVIPYCD